MDEIPYIKNNELLEIYARLPLKDQPKESKKFIILGNEWNFYFTIDDECTYVAYLQLKNKKVEFEPFEVDYEVGFAKEDESIGWGTQIITNDNDRTHFWYHNENDLIIPFDYDRGNVLLFKLRFQFQIEPVLNYISKQEHKAEQTPPYIDASFLLEATSKDFLKLYQEGVGHDVQLICEGQTVKAHKVVLCCRSTFFASKFEDEDTHEVKIQNMHPAIFEQFSQFFYTGKLPELTSENAIRLYEAAVEYCIDALRKISASFLIEHLSRDNAVEILKIFERYKDLEFKKYVMEYMTEENTSLKGEIWTKFCKENPTLANEVLNLYVEVQQPLRKKPRLS